MQSMPNINNQDSQKVNRLMDELAETNKANKDLEMMLMDGTGEMNMLRESMRDKENHLNQLKKENTN